MGSARPTAFVVLTSPRTGSSWLIDLLDSHPRITAYAELLLPADTSPPPDYGCRDLPRFAATLGSRRRITLVPERIRYLRRLFAPRAGIDAIGFKLMHRHVRAHPGLLPFLVVRRTRVINLVRENVLEQLVSWQTAVARGRFKSYSGDPLVEVSVHVDVQELSARLARREQRRARSRRALARHRLRWLDLSYEHILASPEEALGRVVDFLGVQPRVWPASSTLVRMNTGSWRASVENANEIEAALAGTTNAWMLGDPG